MKTSATRQTVPCALRLFTKTIVLSTSYLCFLTFFSGYLNAAIVNVSTSAQLTTAVNSGLAGDTVNISPGTYLLTASLKPKPNMIIQGAGSSSTILRPDASWNPGPTGLPGDPVDSSTIVRTAYLFDFGGNDGIKISNLTMDGMDQLHGAAYGYDCDNLELFNLYVKDFLMSGFRSFSMSGTSIHDCVFEDAGGNYSGDTGGGIYATWVDTTSIYHNKFYRSTGSTRDFYGIKCRKVTNGRMYNNTIYLTNFSIECAHENDADVEIDHNYLLGTISIPKGGGGSVPASGVGYHIHHNYFRKSYALEWARRAAEIDNNLFDFSTAADSGNLISNFDNIVSSGGTTFHDNLVKNPGRGIYWGNIAYNNFSFFNNHVIANTTITPRTDGLFGFDPGTTFSTITIKDNIFECIGQARPLFRNSASYGSVIQNNTLTGISDSGSYANPNTGATRGPLSALLFSCGTHDEYFVNSWLVGLVPVADVYVWDANPTTNYGTSTGLLTKDSSSTGYDRISYLRFDLSKLAAAPASATLQLRVSSCESNVSPSTPAYVNVYSVADDTWGETTATWNVKPATSTLLGTLTITGTGDKSISLTSYISSQFTTDKKASIALVSQVNQAKAVTYYSREGQVKPVLLLQ